LEQLRIVGGRKRIMFVAISTQFWNKASIYIRTEMLINVTIGLKLLQETVESNPGPHLDVLTYNCNGLRNQSKLKRLILKIQPMVEKGAIIFLQETHIVSTDYLSLIFKHKFVSNCTKTNSAGVIILVNKEYEIQQIDEEVEGRNVIVVVRNEKLKFILMNSYFPNDHKGAKILTEKVYYKLLETQSNYPDHHTIWAGDFNVCLTPEDCLNRQRSKYEQKLADSLIDNNKILKLEDAYRKLNPVGGFTWKRGECYSRLDHIFVTNDLSSQVKKAETEWAFEIQIT
jgi:exonuclease III